MSIRTATENDAPYISALCEEVQRLHATALPEVYRPASQETFPVRTVCELMASPDRVFFIADVDGEPAGYLYAELQHQPETPFLRAMDMLYLHHISVHPRFKRHGIGSELMDAVKSWAKVRGVSTVKLHVCAFNETAMAFFESAGYARLSQSMVAQV